MYHSISFDDIHSYRDLHLVPTSRPAVNPPEAKTIYADVAGIDGPLDLSTALTGFMLYGSRSGSWEFMARKRILPWETEYMDILNRLHGKRFEKIILDDDPAYYYKGRLFVSDWKSEKANTFVSISYELQPYKYELFSSVDDWLWDPFNFETGIIREYSNLTVDGTLTLEIPGSARPHIPIINASGTLSVTYKGITYELSPGANLKTDILIGSETATLTFTGTGSVSVIYQGAWL